MVPPVEFNQPYDVAHQVVPGAMAARPADTDTDA